VVCLDPRIVTKPYGRLFIESLPDCQRSESVLVGTKSPSTRRKTAPVDRPKRPT
jgi:Rad3-related DNA helicase